MILKIFSMKVTGEEPASMRRYLSARRLEEAEHRREGRGLQLFLGAEVLLNRSLALAEPEISLPVAWERGPHGKPFLLPPNERWHVNWSHSGGYVLCAVSDREVGVDLQEMDRPATEPLVRRFLQPEEQAFYERADLEERTRLFYTYWTLKESFLKARGSGFSGPLSDFYIRMDGAYPEPVCRTGGARYSCRSLAFGDPAFAAAVCWEGGADPGELTVIDILKEEKTHGCIGDDPEEMGG